MSERNQDQLDELLGRHFAYELDGQRGRAERYFLHSTAQTAPSQRRTAWWAAWGSVAAAACAAVVWMLPGLWQRGIIAPVAERDADAVSQVTADAEDDLVELRRTLVWQTLDEGTLVVDQETPLRKVRLQSLERVQWYDRKNQALVEATVPKEEVIFVGMQTY